MRLGDLDALKQTFAEYGEKAKFTQGACQQLIDNAPTVEGEILTEEAYSDLCLRASRERPQGKWIPTSEFSPEEYDSYLVMWRFRSGEYDGKLFYEICEYDPDEDEWERIEQAGEAGAEIVAWMPLPERYEPKQDDDTAKDMI